MKINLVPELRFIDLPVTAHDIVDSGVSLWNLQGEIWAIPDYPHPYIRVGDILAAWQSHPLMKNKQTHSTPDGYLSRFEDDQLIYELRVIQKG